MRYAIFDLDGTLTDSMTMWRNVANTYLAENGFTPQDDFKKLKNSTWIYEFVKISKERFNFDIDIEEFYSWMYRYVLDKYTNEIQLKDGARELLDKLLSQGVKMCICSSTDRCMMLPALQRLELLKYFQFTCHCREFGSEKDSPSVFMHCMEKLGAKNPHETVIFEDAYYSVKTAVEAGFYTVAIYDSTELNQQQLKKLANQYLTEYSQLNYTLLPL